MNPMHCTPVRLVALAFTGACALAPALALS